VPPLRPRLQAALTGRYVIERELGRGGMAIVFLARDLRNARPVALKVLRPELAAELGPERFLQEIKIAAALTHPHILPLYDSGEADGCLYYVMPYMAGESLRERLEHETSLHAETAIRLAREIADALHYAHEAGIIHRDIKPENILLAAGHAVVADFGISRAVYAAGGRLTQSGLAVGTPDYMSPEQAAGADDIDGRSDVYSLGCVLYEMLTGRPPERGRALSLTGLRPSVPVGLREALERALAPLPEGRFRTAGEFGAALAARGQPPFLRRVHWRLFTGAGLGLLALLGLGVRAGWIRVGPGTYAGRDVPPATAIAVLYFEDQSLDRKIPEVASGFTEDLIDQLVSVPVLRVISPNGVRPYRGTNVPLDSIARALNVGTIVSGGVARWQDSLRVSVRLIDAANGVQVSSAKMDLPWSDLLRIRDSVVEDVAVMLRRRLGEEVRLRQRGAETTNALAWQVVQQADLLREQGAAHLRRRDRVAAAAALHDAGALLERAATLDPAWTAPPIARARLAYTRALLVWEEGQAAGRPGDLVRASSPTGRAFAAEVAGGVRAADGALAARPDLGAALEIRGRLQFLLWSYFQGARDDTLLAGAERDLRAAVTGDSSRAVAWFTLSELYRRLGRFPEADQAARAALDADAYLDQAPSVMAGLFFSALSLEHWDDARTWCERGVRRFPTRPNFVDCRLRVLGWTGRGNRDVAAAWQALAAADRGDSSPVLWADRRLMVAAVLARSGGGLADSARALVRRTRAAVRDAYLRLDMAYAEAYVHLLLGEREEALRLLATYLQARPQERGSTAQHPWWRPLRDDPRFQALVRPPAAT
jgi:eukaryotic-like serine/threonine-protein kinase